MTDDVETLLRRRHVKVPTRRPYTPPKRSRLYRFYQVISPDNINRWLQRYYEFVFALVWGR